eukprot:3105630-Rhodomonas_salina.1
MCVDDIRQEIHVDPQDLFCESYATSTSPGRLRLHYVAVGFIIIDQTDYSVPHRFYRVEEGSDAFRCQCLIYEVLAGWWVVNPDKHMAQLHAQVRRFFMMKAAATETGTRAENS